MGSESENIGKYAKLAVLSTLSEPKSLSELGIFWYNENGRFYKKKAREEIHGAVEKDILIKQKSKYKANTGKIVSDTYSKISNKNLKDLLCCFWNHPFSQQTFLCCKAVKEMFNNNPEKAGEAKISLVLNTPLALHILQERSSEVYSLFVTMQGLESYTNHINNQSEQTMSKIFSNLKQKTDWTYKLNKIISNNGFLLSEINNELKTKQIMKNGKTGN